MLAQSGIPARHRPGSPDLPTHEALHVSAVEEAVQQRRRGAAARSLLLAASTTLGSSHQKPQSNPAGPPSNRGDVPVDVEEEEAALPALSR